MQLTPSATPKKRLNLTLAQWINQKNRKQQGMTAIHYVAFNGDLKLLKDLISYGGEIRQ